MSVEGIVRNRIALGDLTGLHLLGTRHSAKVIRRQLVAALELEESVELDFDRVTVTQSFADELLGPLILERGHELLTRMRFKGCSDDVRAVLTFVVGQRLLDYEDSLSASGALRNADSELTSF